MLMDVIGIVIAFSVVMLLLSLMVTSLGQATQSFFRLRGRNVKYGLTRLLNNEIGMTLQESKTEAAKILNDVDAAQAVKAVNPNSIASQFLPL